MGSIPVHRATAIKLLIKTRKHNMENTILTAILIVGILVAIGVMIHTAMDEYKNTKIRQESVGKVYGFKKSATGSDARHRQALRNIAESSVASEEEPKVTNSIPKRKPRNFKSKTKSRRNIVKAGRRANR